MIWFGKLFQQYGPDAVFVFLAMAYIFVLLGIAIRLERGRR